MSPLTPASASEFAATLAETARRGRPINIIGNNSKTLMAGPVQAAATTLSTSGLRQILRYEPNDLTVSVEAGVPFLELQAHLRSRGQMIALDPPFAASATVGGIVASNSSGPLRCAFGTARDLVIGMTFAMLDGKLVSSGGMVVKNVAGLDIGKLMIGSFGTLAVMTSVNFRLHPRPAGTRTLFAEFSDPSLAVAARDQIKGGPLQPLALELLSPTASARLERKGYLLTLLASGSPAVLARYQRELAGFQTLPAEAEPAFWQQIRFFTPEFLRRQSSGIVVRLSTPLQDLDKVLRLISGPSVSHAASGVTYAYFSAWAAVAPLWRAATENRWAAVVEFAPNEIRQKEELWVYENGEVRQNSFAMMKRVKEMFDPEHLLNPSRLYGRV